MISRIKVQNGEIKGILAEVAEIQDLIHDRMKQIKAVDGPMEELIFKDAQKDKVSKDIYKEI